MLGLLPRGTIPVLIVAVLVFASFQYVPVYFDAWQFYDSIRQEVKFAGTSRQSVDSVREEIIRQASEFDIALEPRDVSVESQGPFFVVEIRYSVPIDLRFYEHEIEFDWSLSGEAFQ